MEAYKILLVDDNPDNLKHLVSIFLKHLPAYKIFQTNRPTQVENLIKNNLPDLIITDWDMPELSGLELIRKLKTNPFSKEIPIIMATGVMLSTEHLQEALDAGAMDYIRKPIDAAELIARTRAALMITTYYKLSMQQKDQELTESSLFLVKSNEFVKDITAKLKKIEDKISTDPESAKKELSELRNELLKSNQMNSWQRFNDAFVKVHQGFFQNLSKAAPKLTPAELKLCSFIRLGLSNKEIAVVLSQSPDSVKVSRYRLRKKLTIATGDNLESFLTQM